MAATRRSRRQQGDRSWRASTRAPCIARWPGQIGPGKVENGIFSGLGFFPTRPPPGIRTSPPACSRASNSDDRTYKNHLDGYNQMDLLTGKGPIEAPRNLLLRRGQSGRGPHRRFEVPVHPAALWLAGEKDGDRHADDVNFRQDPFERTPSIRRRDINDLGGGYMNDFYGPRVLAVRLRPAKGSETRPDRNQVSADAISGFSISKPIKKKIDAAMKSHEGQ